MRRILLIALTAGLVLASPLAATADPVLTIDPVDQSVEYGEAWQYSVSVDDCVRKCATVVIRQSGETSGVRVRTSSGFSETDISQKPLAPGDYAFRASAGGSRSPSATLTVEPAALDVDLRIVPDKNHPTGAIVIAQLSGAFVERIHAVDCSGCPDVGSLPTGTWDVAIRDSAGNEVFRESVTTTTANVTSTENVSLYWQDVPTGEEFTASAEFTPSSQIDNFAITAERDIPYSSPEAPAAGELTIPDALPATVQQPNGPTLPLWGILVAIVVFVLLVVAAALIVRVIARSYSRPADDDEPVVIAEPVTADEPVVVAEPDPTPPTPELTEGPRS